MNILMLCVVVAALAHGAEPEQEQAPASEVIHRLSIDDKREIVVSKGPVVPVEVVKGLTAYDLSDGVGGFFTLDIVLRADGSPPLVLRSRSHALYGGSDYEAYDVLDAALAPGRVIVALEYPDSSIVVLEVNFIGKDRGTDLHKAAWTVLDTGTATGDISAKITCSSETGETRIDVMNHYGRRRQYTVYHQVEKEWRFERTDWWRETDKRVNPSE